MTGSVTETWEGKPEGDGQSRTASPQPCGKLLQLPRELRDKIYKFLLASTRLAFGKRRTSYTTCKTIKPAPNSLAVLLACRQINDEVGSLWLSLVLFSFERVEDLLDKLSQIPPTTLSQIRHVRTNGRGLMLAPNRENDEESEEEEDECDDGEDGDKFHCLVWALKMLPELRLERLTVLGPEFGMAAYCALSGLISYGNGWRELHFIAPDSSMLGQQMLFASLRKPQPGSWNEIISQRDGGDSGASVTIYRSTTSETPGAVLCPQTRQIFEQIVSRQEDLERFRHGDDESLMSENEKGKELLVIVNRGHNVDIAERTGPPYHEDDMRQWTKGMAWAEVRRRCFDYYDESFGHDVRLRARIETKEVDQYNHVDDYEWPVTSDER